MKKEEIVKAKIIGYGMNGEGVAKHKTQTLFIPFTMQEEIVKAKITKTKGNVSYAQPIEILTQNPNRQTPICPHFMKCGGCNLSHIPYEQQLKIKQSSINTTLSKQLGNGHEVKPVIACPKTTEYRNKIELAVQGEKIGFLSPSSHTIIEITSCSLCGNWLKKFLEIARNALKNNSNIKNIVIRTAKNSTCITLVTNSNEKIKVEKWIEPLKNIFRGLSLFQNINTKKTSEIFGDRFIHLYGEKTQTFEFCGVKFTASPYSFLQINDEIAKQIYEKTLENIPENSNVVNAYSGAGFLTAMLAKKAKNVIGIEINKDATNDANKLMQENNIKNVKNICGDCGKLTSILHTFNTPKNIANTDYLEENNKKTQKNDVFIQKNNKNTEINDYCENKINFDKQGYILVVDPPRAGLDKKFVAEVLNSKPEKIIYISCNPATLARDLKVLSDKYKISLIQPFDMFPHTKHIETLCILKPH